MSDQRTLTPLPSRLRCIASVWWMPPAWRAVLREAAAEVEAYRESTVNTGAVWRAVERLEGDVAGLKAALVPGRGVGEE